MGVFYPGSASLGIATLIWAALACGWPLPSLLWFHWMVGPGIGSLLSAFRKLREALYPIMFAVVLLLAWLLPKPYQDNFYTYP